MRQTCLCAFSYCAQCIFSYKLGLGLFLSKDLFRVAFSFLAFVIL
jgi:hypothetical protein